LSKDSGGLSREFFTTLMQKLLDPNLGLFQVANTPEFTYKINEDSIYIDNHHTLFFFFGKVLAKALFDNIPVNVCLNKAVFKAILGQTTEVDFKDLDEFKCIDINVRTCCSFLTLV
jgi:HECT-domain (ubiquitin-transferase)